MNFGKLAIGQKFLDYNSDGSVFPVVNQKIETTTNAYSSECHLCGGEVNHVDSEGFEGHHCPSERVLPLGGSL